MAKQDIRSIFLDFFKQQGHEAMPGAPLVPEDDPSILFTVAGMIQFKRVFLGQKTLSHDRVTTAQPCLRAGGKHNDLREVGPSPRHHTFFEMLGNFSFGAYFKEEAIQMAWTFLTEVLKLPQEKLWITVYKDDQETKDFWIQQIGIDPDRISLCGEADNFWSMGDTGPCGPCTEIFYDYGPDVPGVPPGHELKPGEPDNRYVEIWNLVFMQYDRDSSGTLIPLPKPSVDTGMGLERITSVMEGVSDNYQTSLFQPLFNALNRQVSPLVLGDTAARIVVDHFRAAAFLIADGVMPGNEGRSYVLRRIMRRAMRYAYQANYRGALFSPLLPALIQQLGDAYPHLQGQKKNIQHAMDQEEKQFARTIDQGMQWMRKAIEDAKKSSGQITAEVLFQLYDTYGFPIDLAEDMATESGLTLDMKGYEQRMAEQVNRSRAHQAFQGITDSGLSDVSGESRFLGYDRTECSAKIVALSLKGKRVSSLSDQGDTILVLDQTPFYPEGGGQVGDRGVISRGKVQFEVHDTQKEGAHLLHYGRLMSGSLKEGDGVEAVVSSTRFATAANHSATHLLHAVLRQFYGNHVVQKGSLVDAKRLRFDFTHTDVCSDSEIRAIEMRVNELIRSNLSASLAIMTPDQANQAGAMALFGESYGDSVRVLSFGSVSKELCGGTHVSALGEIGLFKITQETGVSSGVRRIEAITGQRAIDWMNQQTDQLHDIAILLKTKVPQVTTRLKQQLSAYQDLKKQSIVQVQRTQSASVADWLAKKVMWGKVGFIHLSLEADGHAALRQCADALRSHLKNDLLLCTALHEGKVLLLLVVGSELMQLITAKQAIQTLIEGMGGSGGGRPDLAQGAGEDQNGLTKSINALKHVIMDN
jgi:alanyl-tRNA synthetase